MDGWKCQNWNENVPDQPGSFTSQSQRTPVESWVRHPPMSPHLLCQAVHQVWNASPEHDALHLFPLCAHLWALATLGPTAVVAEGRWHNVARDVRRFVQGCSDCAISKIPRHLPSGKLFPLPVPNQPWSHPGVDFITDLSASNGNTCVLVVIDRFSKYCCLLPLKGLPTAIEMAMLMLNKILYINDILDPTLLE